MRRWCCAPYGRRMARHYLRVGLGNISLNVMTVYESTATFRTNPLEIVFMRPGVNATPAHEATNQLRWFGSVNTTS